MLVHKSEFLVLTSFDNVFIILFHHFKKYPHQQITYEAYGLPQNIIWFMSTVHLALFVLTHAYNLTCSLAVFRVESAAKPSCLQSISLLLPPDIIILDCFR
jgi:hypothetical protein